LKQYIPENELQKINGILIIQYKPFGDILLNTGYLPALREKFPLAKIDYLIQKPYLALLEDNPFIDNLVVMEKCQGMADFFERLRIFKLIHQSHYDLVIDQLRGPGSAQITLFSGAKYRLGWKLKRYNWLYNYQRTRTNDQYYSRMKFKVLEPLGIREQEHSLYYHIQTESQDKIDKWLENNNIAQQGYIVFSPGSPVRAKKWYMAGFAALGDLIQKNSNIKIILLWGPGEKDDCLEIHAKMKTQGLVALPTSFNEAAALINRAKVYISQDGGMNHAAIAVKTPSIALFGTRSNPLKWQAWHKPEHPYLRNKECTDPDDRTLGITPEMVYHKLEELLKIIDGNSN